MKIPSDNRWTQLNEGDVFGVLHRTRNIDLNTPGKAKLGLKPIALTTSASLGVGYTLAIPYFNGKYHAVTTDETIAFDLEGAAANATGINPSFSIYGDALVFNDVLHVTIANNLSSYQGTTWTNSLASLTNDVPHPMCIFDSNPTYKLAIGNDDTVKLYDTSYNASATVLTLPSQYVVTTIDYNNGFLYIGTQNKYDGEAAIFTWDGNTANANTLIPVSGNWVYSVKAYKNTVAAMLSSGELVAVSGASTIRLSALPIFYEQGAIWQGTLNSGVPRVFHRGMLVDGDDIYVNVEALVDEGLSADYMPGFESGIWQYTPETGLNHFASSIYDVTVTDSSLSVTDSVITTSAAHNLKTGDSVVFSGTSGLSGISTGVKYYVTVVSSTTIKLSTSRYGVQNGNTVTITGTADSGDILEYTPNTEYFQYARVSSGAITKPTAYDGYFKNLSTPIIWGASTQDTDIADRRYALYALSDAYNVGVIETQRIYTQNIKQAWNKLMVFLDGLHLDNEKIVIKYKKDNELGKPTKAMLGVWQSTTVINSNPSNYDEFDWNDTQIGDEVVILDGGGRGYSAHVESIDTSSSVFSIEVDEAIGVADKPCRVMFTDFKKAGTITNGREEQSIGNAQLNTIKSGWVKFKLELRGFQTEIAQLDLENTKDK